MNEAGDVWSSVFKAFAEAAEQEGEAKKLDSTEDEFIAVTKETDEYLGYPLQNHIVSPLDWWRHHAAQFLQLAKLTKKFTATCQISVLRLFSEYAVWTHF